MARALPWIHGNPMVRTPSRSNLNRPFLCHRSMVVTMSNNQPYWTSINADIEAHLKESMPIRPPLAVFEPMHHLTFAATQTAAPALCVASCELVGGHRNQAMAAASALRIMHAAAFTHEHLPLTDRPRPWTRSAVSHAYGPNIELLTGDGMIPFGLELVAGSDDPTQSKSEQILRVLVEITRAMGSQGMIDGQYNELEYKESDGGDLLHASWMDRVCRKKEGELHACAGACGAILGGGSEEEIEKLRRFGLYVGMIRGVSNRVGKDEKWAVKEVSVLRDLALKELEDFNREKVDTISSLVEAKF